MTDLTIVLSGEAGQGLQTIEHFLMEALNESYYAFASKEIMSRVRGGNNSVEIRVSDEPVYAYKSQIDVLFLLNNHSFYRLKHRVTPKTRIFCQLDDLTNEEKEFYKGQIQDISFIDIASKSGSVLFANTVVFGFVLGLLDIQSSVATKTILEKFHNKNSKIIEGNLAAFKTGFDFGTSHGGFASISPRSDIKTFKVLTGTEAIGLGALAGGCNFISSYPMSPSTGVLQYLADKSLDFDIAVEQAEDEIAALNMVIGSWYAGARGLATTSGGGFALMEEAVSLSGITETPFVLHLAQRPGPGTGLPTRTGQEDLNLVVYSGHGEFPRIVLAPGHLADGIRLTSKAFYLADKYQVPVFVLTDQFFLDSKGQMETFDLNSQDLQASIIKTSTDYKRYAYSEDGLSPRGIPNYGQGLVRCDSDEHDELGMITEDFNVRIRMNEKRLSKEATLMADYQAAELIGPNDYDNLVIGWGSTYGVLKESIKDFEKTAYLYIKQPYPLSNDLKAFLSQAKRLVIAENNATGQLANLIQLHLGYHINHRLLKHSGEPFSVEEVTNYLKEVFA